jgi:hypothetical protein
MPLALFVRAAPRHDVDVGIVNLGIYSIGLNSFAVKRHNEKLAARNNWRSLYGGFDHDNLGGAYGG